MICRRVRWVIVIALLLAACWSAACNDAPHYVFAVVGDLQQPGDADYRPVSSLIARQVAASEACFVVLVGDLIFGVGPQKWEQFDRLAQPLRDAGKTLYAIPGNHDGESPEMAAGFAERFGDRHRVVQQPGLSLVLLDSEPLGDAVDWSLGDAQTAWLKSKPWLTSADPRPLLFFFVHRPPYRSPFFRHHDPDQKYEPEKPEIGGLLTSLGADAVFSGHEHLYAKQRRDGAVFYIAGGGGGTLLAGQHHYLLVTVYPEKRRWKVRKINVRADKKPDYFIWPKEKQ